MTRKTLGTYVFKSNSNKLLRVKFRDIAENIVNRVDVPSESGYERFVGGTHLDPDSLKIKRWGSTSDVHAQKLLFKKGHILFGKRRSYLRKAAYADFDGVCSAHMLVLKNKPELILESYFVFFMQSNQFWKTADMISEGSLSPTIKWKILAKQEFTIPSKEEQNRIAIFLWAIEKSIEQVDDVIGKAQRLKKALMKVLLTRGIGPTEYKETALGEIPKSWEIKQIKDVCEINKNLVNPKREPKKKINYIDISSIANYDIVRISEFFGHNSPSRARRLVSYNDILVSTVRPYLRAFTKVPKEYDDYVCSTGFAVLTPKNEINPEFLFQFVKSDNFVNSLQRFMVGSSYPAVTQKDVEIVKIVLPPLEEQHRIVEVLSRMDENLVLLGKHREVLVALKKRLLNDFII